MKSIKKTYRRSIAFLIALILLAGLPMTAFAEGNVRVYSDVPFYSWYYDAVDYLTASGYMMGVGNGKFAPNQPLTRAMTVTVLYRVAGSPDVSTKENPFQDVPAKSWYANAVKWAYANNVTRGTSKTRFSPNEPITREQLACFVIRYAESIQAEFLTDDIVADYSASIIRSEIEAEASPYAVEAMYTMVMEGLYLGNGQGGYQSKDTATRAETAVVFFRLFVNKLRQFPNDAKIIFGEDCLEKSFDDGTEGVVHSINDQYCASLLNKLSSKSKFTETEPAEFEVYYRLNLWGTEYQFAKSYREFDGVKIILSDGSVHYMKYKDPKVHSFDSIIRTIENALK